MADCKTKVTIKKREINKLTELPNTPFLIRDNESKEIFMVCIDHQNENYFYVDINYGCKSGYNDSATVLLARINSGADTLLTSEIILSE